MITATHLNGRQLGNRLTFLTDVLASKLFCGPVRKEWEEELLMIATEIVKRKRGW